MTKDQIYEELDIVGASEESKQAIIANILTTVEGRFVGIIDDVLSEEQATAMGELESVDAVVTWLQENVPESADLYADILRDHIAELKDQMS